MGKGCNRHKLDGQGDDQESTHAEQKQQPQHWLAWRHGIGQPRIPAVDPPQVAKDQHGATQAQHGRLAGQKAGELGDGENEDQIEEELRRMLEIPA